MISNESKFLIGIGILSAIIIAGGVIFFSKGRSGNIGKTVSFEQMLSGAEHVRGEATAAAKIVEFGDFQCPACGQAQPIMKKFLEEKGRNVYFVFRNFPLVQVHPNANDAARAAVAAGKQGKYWEMFDKLYENQKDWSSLGNAKSKFEDYARELSLDLDKFKKDAGEAIGDINAEAEMGKNAGVQSTPTFFINGKIYPGVIPYEKLVELTK